SIDRAPLGDIAGTMTALISGSPEIDFVYSHNKNGNEFKLDTKEIREILGDVPLDNLDVVSWIDGFINDGLKEIQ
ncbi:MAG: ATP-binding protein, partial [Clostridia bacterium]|nr:ATP-binding protein [Clostridia bacterium]